MNKRFLRTIITAVFAFASILLPINSVYAEDQHTVWLQISPVANRIVINPGDELTHTMRIDNIGTEKFKFRVYATAYTVANENYEINFSTETSRTQISRWIKFNQNADAKKDSDKDWVTEATFELSPEEHQEVEYKISVPEDIPSGGQYATIFAESIPDENTTATGVKTISRVGLILYANTNGETVDKASITNVGTKPFITSGKIISEANVANEGNTDFTSRMNVEIEKFFGGKVAELEGSYPVIPDSPARHISLKWEDTPSFGIFKVKITVSALDQDIEVVKTVLILPIFVIVIVVVLLTIIIVWLIMLIKKRRAQRSRLIV